MRNLHQFVSADALLIEAAQACRQAAKACHRWERGGPSEPVGDTAELALAAFNRALSVVQVDNPNALFDQDPETRQARLILAGYLLLVGTDEDGESADLMLAAKILRAAAIA